MKKLKDYLHLSTKHLLSKHFDLLGLIPARLAIDKSTFKVKIENER